MKIVILNGAPAPDFSINMELNQLEEILQKAGHATSIFQLRDLNIKHCLGCWICWVKTPGQCVHQDDAALVLREIIKADWLIFASPLMMGYPSAVLKQFMDRMIPLVHPYIVLDHGECHHQSRYDAYPKMGLILEKEADTDAEDMEIVRTLFGRVARNMKTSLQFCRFTDEPIQEVCDEINRA